MPSSPLPQQIYVIRHGEKPASPPAQPHGHHAPSPEPPFGVDVNGNTDEHSLLPRGWQRSGALATLFDPAVGPLRPGLRTPAGLYSPFYGKPDKTQAHRTYQTIQALAGRLDLTIQSPVPEGREPVLVETVLASGTSVVLICWEHDHIPALAEAIPTADATVIPDSWPCHRFDVIWTFTLDPATGCYAFDQLPQRLLDGDADTVI
jgi:broad specificity phosphatase PhoE